MGSRIDLGVNLGACPILQKEHDVSFALRSSHLPLVFLVRRPEEVIARVIRRWCDGSMVAFDTTIAHECRLWVKLVAGYVRWPGRRMCLHYEDLVVRPISVLHVLFEFLQIDASRLIEFEEGLDGHVARCRDAYGMPLFTDSRTPAFHAQNLTPEQRSRLDREIALAMADALPDIDLTEALRMID